MVVGYESSSDDNVHWSIYSLSGAASGFVTRGLTQPLDVVKIRLQIQDNPLESSKCVKYKGIPQTISKIFHDEGTAALWKGHTPAQFLSIVYGVVQFSCFERLTRLTYNTFPKPINHFLCGGVAGVVATSISYPFDLVRTRFIVQDHPKVYKSMYGAFKTITCRESVRGLYKGFFPTVVQIAPHTGFQFAFYKLFSNAWDFIEIKINLDHSSKGSISVLKTLVCGSMAGLLAKTAIYPLDFAKKRLQVRGFHSYGSSVVGRPHNYKGLCDCLVTVVKQEGFLALYNGLAPSLCKAVTTSALIFCFYEQFFKFFHSLQILNNL